MGSDEEYLDNLANSLMEEDEGAEAEIDYPEKDSDSDSMALDDLVLEEPEIAEDEDTDIFDREAPDAEAEAETDELAESEPPVDGADEMADPELLEEANGETEVGLSEEEAGGFSDAGLMEDLAEMKGASFDAEAGTEDGRLPEDALAEEETDGVSETTLTEEEANSLLGYALDGEEDEMDEEEEEEGLISPDEIEAMFAAADAVAMDSEEPDSDMSVSLDGLLDDLEDSSGPAIGFADDIQAEEEEDASKKPRKKKEKKKKEKKEKKEKEKKEKKEKKPLFGRKKKQAEEAESDLTEDITEDEDAKKPGFFGKLLALLTEVAEEPETSGKGGSDIEPSDENKNILDELDEEDKNKKKKKVKTKKEKDKGEEKKKKEKKEKKKKEKEPAKNPEEAEPLKESRPGKKISKAAVAVIGALCLSLMAMIIVMCSIIPDFFEKREAREAYYQADYEKSYELLYGKKLDDSDTIIFNKAETILELSRKLNSYHNYLGIGKEVQALDALMSGVARYPSVLADAEEYLVTQEVNAIYETILNILNDKYNISEALAKTIIGYDDVTYTRKLESLVSGTPFFESIGGNEAQKPAVTATDILPAEEALLEEELPADSEETMPEGILPEEAAIMEDQSAGTQTEENLSQEQNGEAAQSTGQGSVGTSEETAAENSAGAPEENSAAGAGEDVSSWTGNSGYGSQGEVIQGIRQPINIQIHGN